METAVSVSVVLPAYNEAETIESTVAVTLESLSAFLPKGSFEVIVAEDGCDDRTPEIVRQLAETDDRIKHLHSDERLGRGAALEAAFRMASGETLVYFDTDLATDMRHLQTLIESVRSGEYDIATGSRWVPGHRVERPARRGVPSRIYNGIVRTLLRSELRDHQCGFKAFDRSALFDLLDSIEDEHWFWDTEVLVKAQRQGYTIREFPVEWTPRGDTSVDLIRDVFGMGSQVLRTFWQLSIAPRVTQRGSVAAGALLVVSALILMTGKFPPVWEGYLPIAEVLEQMQGANAMLIGAAAIVYLFSWPIRGRRYRDILEELGYRDGTAFLTGAIFISQTGNLVFPARLGDGIRAYVIKTRRAVPYPTGFASLAAERVFDLLTITAMAGTVFLWLAVSGRAVGLLPTVLASERTSGRIGVLVAAGVGMTALLTVIVILVTARSDRNVVRRAIGQLSRDTYADYVASILERFAGDVQRVAADRGAFGRIGVSSVAIWSLDVATAVLVFAAFEGVTTAVDLSLLVVVSFFAVSVGNLAKVLPLSPGGIGLYEGAFSILTVALLPVSWGTALGAAVVDHAIKNLVTIAGGLIAMLVLNVSLIRAARTARSVDRDDTDGETDVTDVGLDHDHSGDIDS